jgi:DNA-binding response OmpR family regulator
MDEQTLTPFSAPVAPEAAPSTPVPSAKGIVLVVEDEKPLAHALEMKLKHEGYNVKVVMNGEEAIAELKNPGYGMMLLDLIMPRVDGFTVLNEMKSNNISMPVIVLSNLGQEEDRKKAKELGAADYFVKSNTPIADIVTRVKALLPPA